jgi:hypothetical protein
MNIESVWPLVKDVVQMVAVVGAAVGLWLQGRHRTKILEQDLKDRKEEAAQKLALREHELEQEKREGQERRDAAELERKLRREEASQKKKLLEEELGVRREELAEARNARTEHERHIERETRMLTEVGESLGQHIASALSTDVRWLADALTRAKLGSHAQTVFGERLQHFREEKEFIAEKFVGFLIERCRALTESKKGVYLLIDSGTTLYPIFEKFGRRVAQMPLQKDGWLSKVTIVTNNLPGVESLMEFARRDREDRFAKMVVRCKLLPGEPLATYSAVVGDETEAAILSLDKLAKGGDYGFISLVTGNWIRIRGNTPHCPIPLVRNEEHRRVKQAMVDVSNEVYVLAPLGKIFVRLGEDAVNKELDIRTQDLWYKDVGIEHEKAGFVKLVSTVRQDHRLLHRVGVEVETILAPGRTDPSRQEMERLVKLDSEQMPSLLFAFDRLPTDRTAETEIEFPHKYTQDAEFIRRRTHPDLVHAA